MRLAALPLLLLPALAACAGTAPRDNPVTWPFYAARAAAEDPGYAARRAEVERLVKSDPPAFWAEVDAGGGPTLSAAYAAAGVPPARQPYVLAALSADDQIYGSNYPLLIAAFMANGS
ncbi:hypothetical protein [Pseudoroseicyclus tamaricis]|uniref:Uncharacterized protein n=1 Tax=Pseudoroseicyclus tamaricis TaxID=2705421 RepID=A0A6B2JR78_9RHOB|nr:hypothetical protein [Pseudoroseicyclus tamaricis]NDV01067.1 hypothetical protein [Pseudoroseicyclus tamaricis]